MLFLRWAKNKTKNKTNKKFKKEYSMVRIFNTGMVLLDLNKLYMQMNNLATISLQRVSSLTLNIIYKTKADTKMIKPIWTSMCSDVKYFWCSLQSPIYLYGIEHGSVTLKVLWQKRVSIWYISVKPVNLWCHNYLRCLTLISKKNKI
jgi:hypothetical protein